MDIFGNVPMWDGYREPYPFEVHCAIVGIVNLIKEELNKVPAADVAPVVRCKDCIYSYEEFGFIHCTFGPYGDCKVPSQFYCAEGKRKEDK